MNWENWRIQTVLVLITILWLLGIVDIWFPSSGLTSLRLWLFAAMLVLSLPIAKRISTIVLLTTAIFAVCYLVLTGDFSPIKRGLVISLFFTLFLPPLLLIRETVRRLPEMDRALDRFQGLSSEGRSIGLSVSGTVFGSVLTLGTFALTAQFVADEKDQDVRRRAAMSVLRGLGLVLAFSPFTVGMGFVLAFLPGLTLLDVMLPGFIVVALGYAVIIGLFGRHLGLKGIAKSFAAFTSLFASFAFAVLLVVLAVTFLDLTTIQAVALIVPPLCFLRLFFVSIPALKEASVTAFKRLPDLGDELLLFSAAAILGALIVASGAADLVIETLGVVGWPSIVLYLFIAALGVFLAAAGMHSIVGGNIVLALLISLGERIPDVFQAHIILYVWACASVISMSSMSLTFGAKMFRVPAISLMIGPNILYLALWGLLLACLAASLHHMVA